jgi:hypothetical protein
MTEKGQISEPLVTDTAIYIFKLNDLSDHRIVTTRQRSQVSSSGFTRWLEELKGDVGIWLDTEFAAAATGI